MSSRRWLPVVFVVGLPAASFAASPDCPAATLAPMNDEVRPFGHTNEGSLILEEETRFLEET